MPEPRPDSAPAYRAAGVDLETADRIKLRIKELVASTHDTRVLDTTDGFAGGFALPETGPAPTLMASADGVGTKVVVARIADRHDTVGEDLVNHCVDDLLAGWARPLFFLDYIAADRLEDRVTAELVEGFARGCRQAGIALLGGETAEMPDVYRKGAYDLAGFCVGQRVDRPDDGSATPGPGDPVVGLASTGLHTNGYSLARRVVFDIAEHELGETVPWGGESWADALLAVHRSYLPVLEPRLDSPDLLGIAHITGGGFEGNLPRILPSGTGVRIERGSWPVPPLFEYLAERGEIGEDEMYRVFNMGVGLCALVRAEAVDSLMADCSQRGIAAWVIGEAHRGAGVAWV